MSRKRTKTQKDKEDPHIHPQLGFELCLSNLDTENSKELHKFAYQDAKMWIGKNSNTVATKHSSGSWYTGCRGMDPLMLLSTFVLNDNEILMLTRAMLNYWRTNYNRVSSNIRSAIDVL